MWLIVDGGARANSCPPLQGSSRLGVHFSANAEGTDPLVQHVGLLLFIYTYSCAAMGPCYNSSHVVVHVIHMCRYVVARWRVYPCVRTAMWMVLALAYKILIRGNVGCYARARVRPTVCADACTGAIF